MIMTTSPRPWLHRNPSSLSLAGMEKGVPPGHDAPDFVAPYEKRALPELPLRSPARGKPRSNDLFSSDFSLVSNRLLRSSASIEDLFLQTGSSRKIAQLTGYLPEPLAPDSNWKSPSSPLTTSPISPASLISMYGKKWANMTRGSSDTTRAVRKMSDGSRSLLQFSGRETTQRPSQRSPTDTIWKSRRHSSLTASFDYGDNDALDSGYAEKHAAWSHHDQDTGPTATSFYLQPKTYSASDPNFVAPRSVTAYQPSPPATSLRHRDRPATKPVASIPKTSHTAAGGPDSPMTLEAMIAQERARFEEEEFSRDVWQPAMRSRDSLGIPYHAMQPGTQPHNLSDHPLDDSLVPKPLSIRPKKVDSISHFDYSDSDEETPSIMSNARDSVVSHFRKISSAPLKLPSHPSRPAREPFSTRVASSTSRMPPPPAPPTKRKRGFSHGKHPLRSPYPTTGSPTPLATRSMPIPAAKPLPSPPPPSSTSMFMAGSPGRLRQASEGLRRRFSVIGRGDAEVSEGVILTHDRAPDGPDTPMPKKGLFAKTVLKEVFDRARHGGRSAEERRRSEIRRNIVVVRPAEKGPMDLWV